MAAAAPVWQATLSHPFVQETASGALPKEKFDRWVQQDYLFVSAFRRFVGLILTKTDDDEIHDHLSAFLTAIEAERKLFEDYASENSVSLAVTMSPACRGYVDFLLARA